MRRVSNTQAVVGESVVIVGIGCNIDIAVVEIIVREVPVSDLNVKNFYANRRLGVSYVLSKPIPCVRIWIVGLVALPALGMQS